MDEGRHFGQVSAANDRPAQRGA